MPHATAYRRNQWRYERRLALRRLVFALLGGRCAECGSTRRLQVNHIYERDWEPRRVASYYRWLRYWREARAKPPLVNLLCAGCNRRYEPLPPPTETPF